MRAEPSSQSGKVDVAGQDVVFYVLNSDDPASLDRFVAKLCQKILKERRQCDIRLPDEAAVQRLDRTLWRYKPESFIIHSTQNQLPAPIQLWPANITQPQKDVLLNLHPEFPVLHTQFQRTIEVLDQTATLIKRGRQRWKQYKQAGLEPVVHKIGTPK